MDINLSTTIAKENDLDKLVDSSTEDKETAYRET